MKKKIFYFITSLFALIILSGCGMLSWNVYTNTKLEKENSQQQASFDLRIDRKKRIGNDDSEKDCNPKKHDNILVLLALSGGGSRAALLSGLSMIEMEKIVIDGVQLDLLSEVDLISSVSGGSLAAAYYASSGETQAKDLCGKAISGREWNKDTVIELMGKNYILPWIGNWFWPTNIFHYWFSAYDRTDIMAQTFADNLFDTIDKKIDLKFSQLNPARPNLILNATRGSSNYKKEELENINNFGQVFTFSAEDFKTIGSPIEDYDLSRGVMASAAFPAVFNFMTLRNYHDHKERERYVHVFDGGNSDNLGLKSIKRVIWNLYHKNENKKEGEKGLNDYKKIIVISIDAYGESFGIEENIIDPRRYYDFIVDFNFIDSTDLLLARNRERFLTEFKHKTLFPYSNVAYNKAPTSEQQGNKSPHMTKSAELTVLTEIGKKELSNECIRFMNWVDPMNAGDPKGKEEHKKHCDERDREKYQKYWEEINKLVHEKLEFIHINFDAISLDAEDPHSKNNNALKHQLNNISTNFRFRNKINEKTDLTDEQAIICAVPLFFGKDHKCFYNQKEYLASPDLKCKWREILQIFNLSPSVSSCLKM